MKRHLPEEDSGPDGDNEHRSSVHDSKHGETKNREEKAMEIKKRENPVSVETATGFLSCGNLKTLKTRVCLPYRHFRPAISRNSRRKKEPYVFLTPYHRKIRL